MVDLNQLAQKWVEIREESTNTKILLRPSTYNIPPARSRRTLELISDGIAVSGSPSADDRSVRNAGSWALTMGELVIAAPGWTGTYTIEEITPNKLVLCRK
ncbi:MAG: hypothetical protein F6K42_02740 [Leptolyngbya sp. SIO1D8]|nr:hypothetical protein [Leptolyngbya sp. SIO1D8]